MVRRQLSETDREGNHHLIGGSTHRCASRIVIILINIPSIWYGPGQAKKCLRTCAKYADSDHPAHAQSIVRALALHSYILWCPMILLADSAGPDQTARMHRLIWVFAVRIYPKIRFRMELPICTRHAASTGRKRPDSLIKSPEYLLRRSSWS